MKGSVIRDAAPLEDCLTEYDRQNLQLYLRLLDSEESGLTWQDAARQLLHVEADIEPDRARVMHDTHLSRAHWMSTTGYRLLLCETPLVQP